MKKILLLMALFFLGTSAWAEKFEFKMSDQTFTDAGKSPMTSTWGNFEITAVKNNGSSYPTYNTSNNDVRLYAKNSITIKSTTTAITSIDFLLSTQGKNRLPAITANVGAVAAQASGDTNVIWNGETDEVTFTVGDKAIYTTSTTSAGQFCFTNVIITTADGAVAVLAPEFSVASGTVELGTEVTITCATEGASIYYTTDEADPTNASTLYTEPIAIDEDMTIKAIAYKGADKSYVSTAKYTVKEPVKTYKTLAAVKALTDGTEFTYDGALTVIGEYESDNHSYVYVTDGTDYTLIYGSYKHYGYKSGDVLKAGWDGKVSYYAGLFELVPTTAPEVDGTATVPAPAVINADNVAATYVPANINGYYEIKNLVLESATTSSNSNFSAKVGDQTITVRNPFFLDAQEPGVYNVVGFISAYDSGKKVATTDVAKLQFFPISYEEVVTEVAAPEFSINSGAVPAGTQVTITCSTVGSDVLYTGPITINEDMTIKAVAVKGSALSIVVVANYTIEKTYTSIAEITELTNNTEFKYSADLTVVYVGNNKGTYTYVTDGKDYTLIFDKNSAFAPKAGDVIKAGWTGKVSYYGGLYEIAPVSTPTVDGTADVPAPAEMTADNFASLYVPANINGYYEIKNVTLAAATTATDANATATVGENSFTLRNKFTLDAQQPGTYNVVGFIAAYEYQATVAPTDVAKLQFFPISYTSVTDGIAGVEADSDAPVQYYNMSGMRIENPAAGQVVIRVQAGKAEKVRF